MSKTIPLDYYRDPADTERLNKQYYEDDKNFTKLPRELQFLHLKETIAVYGKETLEGDQFVAAKGFGFITDHSSTDNSWLATAANVIASVPKGVVFFAGLSAVLQAAGAYRIVQNALDNFDAENSDTVHHRSPRAAENTRDAGHIGNIDYATLDNNNCFLIEVSYTCSKTA